MGRFKNKSQEQPQIPTSALPDIIFILLFFFMVTTKMKENSPLVITELPKATQLKEVPTDKQKITISIGNAIDKNLYGDGYIIQVGSNIIQPHQLNDVVSETLSKMKPSKRSVSNIVAYLKADESIKMGIIHDVTQRLRKLGVLSIDYSALKTN